MTEGSRDGGGLVSNLGLAFAGTADRYSDRPALLYPEDGRRVAYAELADLAQTVARALHGAGLRQGDVLALVHDKSPAAFAVMLACLRLGIIYTNLDPDSPWPRLQKILAACRPRLVICAADWQWRHGIVAEFGTTTVDLTGLTAFQNAIGLPDRRVVDGTTPAYIMFTSGSTGVPKGAVISHANLLWFAAWSRDRFGITADDVLTNVNPMYFDNSVFDFYSALLSGAALAPLTAAQTREPRRLVRLVNAAGCTVWFSVPSLLVYLLTTRAMSSQDLPAIRKIVFGGEGFPKSRLKELFDMFGRRAELENVYGPTECTCICSAHTVVAEDFADMQQLTTLEPLAQNFAGDILPLAAEDPDFGELFLRGPLVGLGYYNDPERTATAFVQNPRHERYRDIGYRTGDLVRRDGQGRLHFKGRSDFQIKHMGYRIELEEIEAALSSLVGVVECAVVYQSLGDGLGQIVAFVTLAVAASGETLLEELSALLPAYMVPRRLHRLDALPKNANGKIDRLALRQFLSTEDAR